MVRPTSIVRFERLYLVTLLLGAVHTVVRWPALVAASSPGVALVTQLVTFGLTLILVLLVARRRSRIARIILVAAFLIGLPIAVEVLATGVFGLGSWVVVAQIILQALALLLLFRPESRAWLAPGSTGLEER